METPKDLQGDSDLEVPPVVPALERFAAEVGNSGPESERAVPRAGREERNTCVLQSIRSCWLRSGWGLALVSVE